MWRNVRLQEFLQLIGTVGWNPESGNRLGMERLVKDKTRGWKATWDEGMMPIPNHSWGDAWNDGVYETWEYEDEGMANCKT